MDDFLWVEKYRPTNIDECILPTAIKDNLREFIAQGDPVEALQQTYDLCQID